jgi:hypothetical protein
VLRRDPAPGSAKPGAQEGAIVELVRHALDPASQLMQQASLVTLIDRGSLAGKDWSDWKADLLTPRPPL